MLDAAQKGGYAYPAINITSFPTINGALKAFAEAKSDGIIQVSTGGGEFASGTAVKDAVVGSIALADAIRTLAEEYDVLVGLHTDHCQPGKVDTFLKPLIAELPARDRRILSLRFTANMTQSEIGEELGISQMHVSRLLTRTLNRLRKGLTVVE